MILSLAFLRPKHPKALLLGVLFFLVLLALAYGYLASEVFQRQLQARVVGYLESATGGKVRLASFRFEPLRGSTTLTGLSIARADKPEAPYLEAEQALVAFSLLSPLSDRTLSLRSLILEKPQLKLELLENGGGNLSRADGSKPRTVNFVEPLFRIAIDHLEVRQGSLLLKAQSLPLELDLRELRVDLQFDRGSLLYHGDLSFQGGSIDVRSWRADQLAMKARLKFYSQGVEISDGLVQLQHSSVRFSGLLANLFSPDLWLDISAQGSAEEFQRSFNQELGIRGPFQADGRLIFNAGQFNVRGRFSSPEIHYWRIQSSNLHGDFDLDTGGIALRSAAFELLEGQGTGDLFMTWGGTGISGRGRFQIAGLDARSGLSTVLQTDLPVSSAIDGTVTLDWTPRKNSFAARAETILAPAPGSSAASARSGNTLVVSGSVTMAYSQGRFGFEKADLGVPGGTLGAAGWISLDQQAAIDLRYHGDSLQATARQLAALLKWPSGTLDPWLETTNSGPTDFVGRFEGLNAANPITGRLFLSKPAWKTLLADSAQADLSWSRDRLELQPWSIEGGGASTRGSLSVLLSDRSGPPGTLELKGSLDRLPLAFMARPFAETPYPVSGFTSGVIGLRGRYPEFSGEAELVVNQPAWWGETLDQLSVKLTLNGKRLSLERLAGHLGPRQIVAEGWWDLESNRYRVSASGKGWNLRQLLADHGTADLQLEGNLDFTAQGEGALENPAFSGTVRAQQLRLGNIVLEGTHTDLSYTQKQLKAVAAARIGGGKLDLRATTDWSGSTPSLVADLAIDSLNPLIFNPAASAAAPPQLVALLTGSIAVSGPLNQPELWAATAQFPGVVLKLGDLEFTNQGAFEPRYRDGKLTFDATRFFGHRNSFTLSGEIALRPKVSTDLHVVSQFNLDLFNALTHGATLGGMATVAISLQGEPSNPRIFGTCLLNGATASYKELNYSLTNISGVVSFNEHLAGIRDLKGSLSTGGRFTLNGSVNLDRLAVKDFVLQVRIEELLLRIPQGFRTLSNADLVLRGDPASQLLMGEVDVQDAVYSRNVDFLTQISAMAGNSGGSAQEPSVLDALSLNLVVSFSNGIVIKTETVRLAADSRLRILGPATRPSLLGRISANSGEVSFMGNRYEITKGGVEFVNPMRIEPQFDLEAKTTVKGYRINLMLRGTPESIQPEFRSEPPLPVLDLITLLSTGVTSDELMGESSRGGSNLGMAASNILAGGLAQQVENRVQRVLGFSQFKIDPLISARSSNPTARVTVERRLNNNLSVTYSTDITTSKTQIVVVEYFLTPDYSLVASRDENGHYGFDLRIQRKF